MFRLGKSSAIKLIAVNVAILLAAAQVTLSTVAVFAAASPNSNGKNSNGVAHSAKDTDEHIEHNEPVMANGTQVAVSKQSTHTTNDTNKAQEKVRICHRTASYSNPYVSITVARAAVDGIAGNSGNEADHYGEHKGPVFNSSLPKHTEWGDIIPALSSGHNGLNWNDAGRAIYNNGCKLSNQAPIILASVKTSDPAPTPVTPATGQLANTGLNIWVSSLISIIIIAMSALLGLMSRRKLTVA